MGPRRLRQRKTHHRPRWRPSIETLETRRVLSGIPLGALPDDTAEYLLGRVAVTPVFFESNGTVDTESQNWSAPEIEGVLQKIREGMDWWVDTLATLDTVHTLEFVYDDTYALDPVETVYEPVDHTSDFYSRYVGDWLVDVGFGEAKSMEKAIRGFNHQQRLALEADWAFTIIVADASDDPDGQFAEGGSFGQAFAFAGGMFMVVPSTRPAATFAHEMGHLFWARDEYSGGGSWTDQRGYYNSQNLNATDNPSPGFQHQPSVMSSGVVLSEAYANHISPASTLAFVGWQDSDGDGVFDVLDVPLHLEGSGHYDASSGLYTFDGAAWAVALENANPAGLQNDITLNRISRIEYSVDNGAFQTAIAPDSQYADLSFSISLPSDFRSVHIRAVDAETGITSQTIEATPARPGYAPSAVAGYVFLDANNNGIREADEPVLDGLNARITAVAGRDSLPSGEVDPTECAPGALPDALEGVTLSAEGPLVDGRVGVVDDDTSTPTPVLAFYDQRLSRWDIGWSSLNALVADFEEPTGEVRIEVTGGEPDSLARMEAYDADGNYLFRANTAALQGGETTVLRLQDDLARIARVRVFGHARTEVNLGRIEFGPRWDATSDIHGVVRYENLSDGTYEVQLEPELVIHQPTGAEFDQGTVQITVSGGSSAELAIPIRRVDSPWTNLAVAEDVDENGMVEPLDALKIINDLNRHGSRNLTTSETVGAFLDTNNDGRVTPADALKVINALNRQLRSTEGELSTNPAELVATPSSSPALSPLEKPGMAPRLVSSSPAPSPVPAQSFSLAEREGMHSERNDRGEAEQQLPSPAPLVRWATDRVFRDFASGPSTDQDAASTAQRTDVDEDGRHAFSTPDHQKNALDGFFSEPFA